MVIFLPQELDALVAPYREQYDPHLLGAYHSSVSFVSALKFDELARVIAQEVQRLARSK